MLVYARQHREEVAGLVLVEPSHPQMFERVRQVPGPEMMSRTMRLFALLGRVGLLSWVVKRVYEPMLINTEPKLPEPALTQLRLILRGRKEYTTAARESDFGRTNFPAANSPPGSLGDLPLEVLSAGVWVEQSSPMATGILALHRELATASARGRHHLVEGCNHASLPIVRADAVAASVRHVLAQG
jgi:pimeloyl-ACP methyl ester carboxylesterase